MGNGKSEMGNQKSPDRNDNPTGFTIIPAGKLDVE